LVDLASSNDVYAGSWLGPASPYHFVNQTSAIDVLLGGLVVSGGDAASSASPTSPTTSTSTNSASTNAAHKGNVGAIVGGVIGGTIVLFMMIVLAWLIMRQRHRIMKLTTAVNPFVEETGASSMTCTSPSATSILRSDVAAEEDDPPNREREEGQRITIGSLIWELNELLRRRNHEGETPPAYSTASHSSS
jgi:hypothetical protein